MIHFQVFFSFCCFEQTSMREGHYLFNTEKSRSIHLPIDSEDPATSFIFFFVWGPKKNVCIAINISQCFVNINDSI